MNFTLVNKTASIDEKKIFGFCNNALTMLTITWQINKCTLMKYALSYIDIHPHVSVTCAAMNRVHCKYTDKIYQLPKLRK